MKATGTVIMSQLVIVHPDEDFAIMVTRLFAFSIYTVMMAALIYCICMLNTMIINAQDINPSCTVQEGLEVNPEEEESSNDSAEEEQDSNDSEEEESRSDSEEEESSSDSEEEAGGAEAVSSATEDVIYTDEIRFHIDHAASDRPPTFTIRRELTRDDLPTLFIRDFVLDEHLAERIVRQFGTLSDAEYQKLKNNSILLGRKIPYSGRQLLKKMRPSASAEGTTIASAPSPSAEGNEQE